MQSTGPHSLKRLVKMAAALDGVFAVNKPMGMSSAQVIRDLQQQLNPSALFKPMIEQQKAERARESNTSRRRRGFGKNDIRVKMGHGGTLDPLATGVLILGTGKGTKSLQGFLDCTKTYETVVLFGASTDTYDRVGKVLKKTAYEHITRPMVEEAMKGFRGTLQQMPPLYSALKMEGKPLYEYAREGKPIPREIATREVHVSELELVEWYEPGAHNYRWQPEEATSFERSFAEQVWKIEKDQMTKEKRTPDEEREEKEALEAHEQFKRKADESVDALVYDRQNKRRKTKPGKEPPMMSGALGEHPPAKKAGGKGSNLLPPPHDPNTPPPWDDKGPPAVRIRMTVTSGFYVRSFCHDLGVKVGSSACMAELCRSRQGDFVLGSENCLELDDFSKDEETWAPKVQTALQWWKEKGNAKQASGAAPTRAVPASSPKREEEKEKKSIETSPPAATPAISESKVDAADSDSPKKDKSRSPSPKDSAVKKEEKKEKSKEDEEWNGFSDGESKKKSTS